MTQHGKSIFELFESPGPEWEGIQWARGIKTLLVCSER